MNDLMQNKQTIEELLIETGRPGIHNLLNYMENQGYYEAPASTKNHLMCAGGLAQHSLNVYEFGIQNMQMLLNSLDLTQWTIASLLHDLGKASYNNVKYYSDNYLASNKISTSKPYKVNEDRMGVPHEITSLFIAKQFINLTNEEEHAIMYHNGLYVSSGRDLNGKERPLQLTLHFADMYVSRFEEEKL